MTGSDKDLGFDFERQATNPVALVIAPWSGGGVTIGKRDASGSLHGCRDVKDSAQQADVVSAWIEAARRDGLPVEHLQA